MAQAIATRLKLLQGEWWESLGSGTPLFQSILGVPGAARQPETAALILTQIILGSPYVTGVSNVSCSYDPNARAGSFSCDAQTQFGVLTITLPLPGSSASI